MPASPPVPPADDEEHTCSTCPTCRLLFVAMRHGVSPRLLRAEIARLTAEGAQVSAEEARAELAALIPEINADTAARRAARERST